MKHKLYELCVATMVAIVSDRFGVPPTPDDQKTASGLPLSDDSDPKEIAEWSNTIVERFQWMFETKVKIFDEDVPKTLALMKAAFEGDEGADLQLKKMYA
jgi:hypothetical protein